MKKILVALVLVLIGVNIFYSSSRQKHAVEGNARVEAKADTASDAAGKAVFNAAAQASDLDVSALSKISTKLEGACSRNKYGLSEEECIHTIRKRKDMCVQQTAAKYPGKVSDTDKMQAVVSSYADCLFSK